MAMPLCGTANLRRDNQDENRRDNQDENAPPRG